MISCIETVTQHISGQPFCNMSMEALEIIAKHAKNLLFCRPAKSGEDIYVGETFISYVFVCFKQGNGRRGENKNKCLVGPWASGAPRGPMGVNL